MKNICLFGDSLAKGVVLNAENLKYSISDKGFARLMEENDNVTIKNYAKFGCTIDKAAAIIEKRASEIECCDSVMLEIGGNDCDYAWDKVAQNPKGKYSAKTDIGVFKEMYETIVEKLIAMGKEIILLSLPPIDSEKYFSWISRGKDANNIKEWLGSVNYIYRWHEMYSNAVCNIAGKMKVRLIDIRSIFLAERDYSNFICADGIHPNEDGQRLIWKAISNEGFRLQAVN